MNEKKLESILEEVTKEIRVEEKEHTRVENELKRIHDSLQAKRNLKYAIERIIE